MAIQQRRKASAGAAAPASPPSKQAAAGGKAQTAAAKAGGKGKAAAGTPPASSRSGPIDGVLAAAALTVALLSAICEWPIYLAYEKDFKRPAVAFTLNLGITAIISLLVTASPQVRSLKKPAPAQAVAAGPSTGDDGAAAAAAPRPPLKKAAKRQLIAGIVILFMSLYFGFGLYGPSGALTATALSAAMFLGLP